MDDLADAIVVVSSFVGMAAWGTKQAVRRRLAPRLLARRRARAYADCVFRCGGFCPKTLDCHRANREWLWR